VTLPRIDNDAIPLSVAVIGVESNRQLPAKNDIVERRDAVRLHPVPI
jgi:hypothetical protein